MGRSLPGSLFQGLVSQNTRHRVPGLPACCALPSFCSQQYSASPRTLQQCVLINQPACPLSGAAPSLKFGVCRMKSDLASGCNVPLSVSGVVGATAAWVSPTFPDPVTVQLANQVHTLLALAHTGGRALSGALTELSDLRSSCHPAALTPHLCLLGFRSSLPWETQWLRPPLQAKRTWGQSPQRRRVKVCPWGKLAWHWGKHTVSAGSGFCGE